MKYRIKIIETLAMTVEVEAISADKALNQVKKQYDNEEIVVIESRTQPNVEFLVVSE